MRKSDFQIEIPESLIAQFPPEQRGNSRLMVLDGSHQHIAHSSFSLLPEQLQAGDRLVFNNTRVVPARLFGQKETGGRVEILLERITGVGTALAKIRASKSPKPGQTISPVSLPAGSGGELESDVISGVPNLEVTGREGEFFALRLTVGDTKDSTGSILELFDRYGQMPLPPYIERDVESADSDRYQTIYARHEGAVAAPTAGLHFTDALLQQLQSMGVSTSFITLHVGAGTFQPVRAEDLTQHKMHAERYRIDEATAAEINQTRASGGRIIAVGTTSVRTLESAVRASLVGNENGDDNRPVEISAADDETRLFIKPGDPFHLVDGMITNFHLPESTLIMLVAAFAGTGLTLDAYREAIDSKYRFYSYGDAMLVWPAKTPAQTS